MRKIDFLHIFCADTKNTYGIMTQISKMNDRGQHFFLITDHMECRDRFPKLYEFDDLLYMPAHNTKEEWKVNEAFLHRLIKDAGIVIWHSLFFGSSLYTDFLYRNRGIIEKSVWIEWGADLYNWEYPSSSRKNRKINHKAKCIREAFNDIGVIFPVDSIEYEKQFGIGKTFYDVPMPNPKRGGNELVEYIYSKKPNHRRTGKPLVQIGHNAFSFNNHFYLFDILTPYKEQAEFMLPISYGIYGINGQYGGRLYYDTVRRTARRIFGDNVFIHFKNIDFDDYICLLWNIDIAVFDFDRPCGLGTIRILALMHKKIFLPSGTPFYEFLRDKDIPVYDTKKIREMSFEEFSKPADYDADSKWLLGYLNNDVSAQKWREMFNDLEERYFK